MHHTRIATARVGTTLRDKWHLDRLVGVGGAAAVYSATHRNGTVAAVKVLHTDLSIEPSMRARFLREGHLANLVGHPGTVKVIDDDETEDGSAYLVMPLLEGEPVDRRMERGRIPMLEVLRIADDVLGVLVAAHAKGVVHRDLKPENLFLCSDGSVVVMDFGIANERSVRSCDTEGIPMGTPAFMPPEQAHGRWAQVDARSDIWSLGATVYMMLTGRCVHGGETASETLLFAMVNAAPSLAVSMPEAPASLVIVIDRALKQQNAERWPDARSMQIALRAVVSELVATPGMTSRRPPPVEPPSPEPTLLDPAGMSPAVHLAPRRFARNAAAFACAAVIAVGMAMLAVPLRAGLGQGTRTALALEREAPVAVAAPTTEVPEAPSAVEVPAPVASPVVEDPVAAPRPSKAPERWPRVNGRRLAVIDRASVRDPAPLDTLDIPDTRDGLPSNTDTSGPDIIR